MSAGLTSAQNITIQELLTNNLALIRRAKGLAVGPAHILLPDEMEQNVLDFYSAFSEFDLDFKVLFAHKPTKSRAFVHKAKTLGLGIDVASFDELNSALSSGFIGDEIECTGPKAERFIEAALVNSCLISVDSIPELIRLKIVKQRLALRHRTKVLLRMTDLVLPGRTLIGRASRFGIRQEDLREAYEILRGSDLELAGFHVHSDKRASSDRASQLEALISLYIDAHNQGFLPRIINIGGGFRREQFTDSGAWEKFIGELEESIVTGTLSEMWGAYAYGLQLNSSGKIMGRAKALSVGSWTDFSSVIREMLSTKMLRGGSIASFIRDNEICLMSEPGYALLNQCGFSLFDVLETKRGGGGHEYVLLDGHSSNVAVQYREIVTNPILLPSISRTLEGSCSAFLVGTVCREEDLFLRRKVPFTQRPESGDIICFCNTAAYRADFEDSAPHQHPRGTALIVRKLDGQWRLLEEGRYQHDVSLENAA